MIHVIGDSHALYTFREIDGVAVHHLGPMTMRRASDPADNTLRGCVGGCGLTPADRVVFCLGEIDVRCHIHSRVQQPDTSVLIVVIGLVDAYLKRIVELPRFGATFGVMSVPPPSGYERDLNETYPMLGTDEDRALYTKAINAFLLRGCLDLGLVFVDLYSAFVGVNGLLPPSLSDGEVHLKNPWRVGLVLRDLGWIDGVSP